MISKSHKTHVPVISILHNQTNIMASNSVNNLNNSHKVGSRRIFTPHFKLQVLESYRNDSDCKGNQRATARKYNIHRRQIQKWLQCESNLRSSVANINHSSIQHQFHNMNQQQMSIIIPTKNSAFYIHRFEAMQNQLPLETTKQSAGLNSLTVPSLPSLPSEIVPSNNISTQSAYTATNLDTFVPASAAGALEHGGSSFVNTTKQVTSALCPPVLSSNSTVISPPIVSAQHHLQSHHIHYDMSYTHLAARIPISAPILAHSIPQSLHQHYHYHNEPQTQSILQPKLPTSTVPTFKSSACLPVNALSLSDAISVAAPVYTTVSNTSTVDSQYSRSERTHTSTELSEDAPRAVPANSTELSRNACVHNDKYVLACTETCKKNKQLHLSDLIEKSSHALCLAVTPMDLSTGTRHFGDKKEICSLKHPSEADNVAKIENDCVVDLTFRKRKVISEANGRPKLIQNSKTGYVDSSVKFDVTVKPQKKCDNGMTDIEMEVKSAPSKPVKLFKPYLLDSEKDNNKKDESVYVASILPTKCSEGGSSDQYDPTTWNNQFLRLSPKSFRNNTDGRNDANIQLPNAETHIFPVGSSSFQGSKSSKSAFRTTPLTALSPVIRCVEGSPVSGYESSSSTYSDSSYKSEFFHNKKPRKCSLDLHAHTICECIPYQENCVQKWFNYDTNSNPPTTNSSIALYA